MFFKRYFKISQPNYACHWIQFRNSGKNMIIIRYLVIYYDCYNNYFEFQIQRIHLHKIYIIIIFLFESAWVRFGLETPNRSNGDRNTDYDFQKMRVIELSASLCDAYNSILFHSNWKCHVEQQRKKKPPNETNAMDFNLKLEWNAFIRFVRTFLICGIMHLLNVWQMKFTHWWNGFFSIFLDNLICQRSKERTFRAMLMTKFLINIHFMDIQIERINVKQYASHLKCEMVVM